MSFVSNLFWELFEIAIPFLLIAIPVFVMIAVSVSLRMGFMRKRKDGTGKQAVRLHSSSLWCLSH